MSNPNPKPTSKESTTQPVKSNKHILVYVIVFAIQFLVILGLLTWVLGVYYQNNACGLYPNIWCSDMWTCNTVCQGGDNPVNPQGLPVNRCYGQAEYIGSTGLASCVFGPDAPGATVCFTAPTGPPTGGTGLGCDCISEMQGPLVTSCFNGCAANLDDVASTYGAICCCTDPNNPACAVQASGGGYVPTGICA